METLQDITKRYSIFEEGRGEGHLGVGTDKLVCHNYPAAYEELFSGIRENVRDVLEIGVAGGWSLKVWEEYFPNATIHGVDIDEATFNQQIAESPRINMNFFDGTQEPLLHEHFEDKSFDVIIDDGSHKIDHQVLSAAYLWPKLRANGVYVIEDTEDLRYDKYFTMYPNYKTYNCASDEYKEKGDATIGTGIWEGYVAWNSTLYTFKKNADQ